jgi:hypothetical protein
MATVSTKLTLDSSGFNRGLKNAESSMSKFKSMAGGAAMAGIAAGFAAATAAAAGLAVGIKNVLDIGGALSDLSTRTGIAAGELRVLQEAFKQNGLSAEQVGPAVNKLQRALVEAGQKGGEVARTFDGLGINIDQLRGMNAADQFQAIGAAINALPDPAARAAAAMQIFGRSGGELLTLFSNSGALTQAATTVGAQAELLTKNANMFDQASDILNSVGAKLEGFFVGIADQVVPAIMPLLEAANKLDFAAVGQKLGAAIRFGLSAISSGKVGELLFNEMSLAALDFTNSIYRGLKGATAFLSQYFSSYIPNVLGSALKDAFSGVTGFMDAAVGKNNVFGKISDVVASALIYAVLRWQVAMFDAIKASLNFYGQLWNAVTGNGTDGLRSMLLDTVKFFASDFGKALQNPIAFIAGKLATSLTAAATDSAKVYKQSWDAATGNFIDKAYAGVSGVAENARLKLGSSSQQLLDSFKDSSRPMVSQDTLDIAQKEGSALGAAFSKAVNGTGDIFDTTGARNARDATRAAILAAADVTEAQSLSRFEATKTATPLFDEEGAGATGRNNTGILTQSLQSVGGGAAFARFSDAANPAAQAVREQQKTNNILSRIETKLGGNQPALMPI